MIRPAKLAEGRKVGIMDTTLRDAHQSLFATRMNTPQMLRIAAYLDKVGFFSMKSGRATFDTALRYLSGTPGKGSGSSLCHKRTRCRCSSGAEPRGIQAICRRCGRYVRAEVR